MARFGMVGGTYQSQSLDADAQRTVNLYVESIESQAGKSTAILCYTPGTKLFCALGGHSVPKLCEINGRVFGVSSGVLYELRADGSKVQRGTVQDEAPVSMVASSLQLLVAAGGKLSVLTLADNTFVAVATDLGNIVSVGWADEYFIALIENSSKFQLAKLNDATQWDDLDVFQVSVFPDNVRSMIVDHREIWLFGAKKTVPYYDSGDPDNPWQPRVDILEQGIGAAESVVRADNSLLWIGEDERGGGIAWRAQGYTPVRVSNHATEHAWAQYPKKHTDAVGYSYQLNGHTFWQLYFPSGNATWALDLTTGLWFQLGFWKNGRYEAHHSQCHVYAFGKHLVGDWGSGNVYELSDKYYDDCATEIRRMRRAPYIANDGRWIFFNQLEVIGEFGDGPMPTNLDGTQRPPQMMLRWSDDGARTWSNDHWKSAGKIGEYALRAVWRRMGRCWGSRGRVYELTMTDPIPWRITDAYIDPPMERMASNIRKMT